MSIDVDDLTPFSDGQLVKVVPAPVEDFSDGHAVVDANKFVVCETITAERADLVAAAINDRYTNWLRTR